MPGKVNEQAWNRAESIIRKQYKNVSEDSDKFWKLVQHVYQNIEKGGETMKPILLKAHVKAHQRHLKSGKVVPVREYDISHVSGSHLVTTHLNLKGRGITQLGDGSDHARGLNTYRVTDVAFKKVQQQHGEFHYRNKGESLTRGEQARKRATLAEKNAASQQLADRKAINELKEQRTRLGDNQRGNRQLLQTRIDNLETDYKTDYPHESGRPGMWEYHYGHAGSVYITTNADLKGGGIKETGKDLQGFKSYRVSDLAFELLKKKYGAPRLTKSMENKPMDTLEKYPALMKAVGSVKGHQRRMKSGKVVTVQEHTRGLAATMKHTRIIEMMRNAREDGFVSIEEYMAIKNKENPTAEWLAQSHIKWKKIIRTQRILWEREHKKWLTGLEARRLELQAQKSETIEGKAKKSQESEPMDNIDLTKFPALAKAIEHGSLSKSLEFVKTGKEIYLAVMAKIGDLQGELLVAVGQWKAGIKPSTSVTDDMPTEGTKSVGEEESSKEPWEIRAVRRRIDSLQRIARNIDQSKKFKLSEYELQEYGL